MSAAILARRTSGLLTVVALVCSLLLTISNPTHAFAEEKRSPSEAAAPVRPAQQFVHPSPAATDAAGQAAHDASKPVPISRAVAVLKDRKARSSSGGAAIAGCQAVTITSAANRRYVSAELGYGGDRSGMLRARATAVGPWEQFAVCEYGSRYVIGSLANGRYVSSELGWGGDNYGMLRARASQIGPWEQYYIGVYGSNVTIRSAANGRYVSTELGWGGSNYGMLRARATAIGPWELYY